VIYDVFLYNGEPIAEARIKYLQDHVDMFVVVEACETFSGQPKARHLDAAPFKDHPKVRLVPVGPIITQDPWEREAHQRNAGLLGLFEMQPTDVVFCSDVDEIYDVKDIERVREVLSVEHPAAFCIEQDFYYYNLNWKKPQQWRNALVCNGAALGAGLTFQAMRGCLPKYFHSGWHISYAESWQNIKRKIESFSHQEFNKDNVTSMEHLKDCFATGKDLFMRLGEDCIKAGLDGLPQELLDFHAQICEAQKC
jgi:hypothetical protein